MPPDDDISQAEMRRWLTRVESSMVAGFSRVDDRFERLQRDVQTAAFVPLTLYQSERDSLAATVERQGEALGKRIDGVDRRIDNMRTLVVALVGLTLTAIGLVVSLARLAG